MDSPDEKVKVSAVYTYKYELCIFKIIEKVKRKKPKERWWTVSLNKSRSR